MQRLHRKLKTIKKENYFYCSPLNEIQKTSSTMFKVLGAVIYCIMDMHNFLDYVFLKKDPNILSFDKGFGYESYIDISGVITPELLMNIVPFHVFEK